MIDRRQFLKCTIVMGVTAVLQKEIIAPSITEATFLLSDYEAGTFSPIVNDTKTMDGGTYTRIGDTVYFNCSINSSSEIFSLEGLPFKPTNTPRINCLPKGNRVLISGSYVAATG